MALDDLRGSRLAFAGVSALTVLTWYALPDAVRSRRARVVIKAGLLAVTGAGAVMIPRVYPGAVPDQPGPQPDLPGAAVAALACGAAAVAAASNVWFEKAIFAVGEDRRAGGVRCAHTPVAAALALATGAAALIDWNKLTRKVKRT